MTKRYLDLDNHKRLTLKIAVSAILIALLINAGLLVLLHKLNYSELRIEKEYDLHSINVTKILPEPMRVPEPRKQQRRKKKKFKPHLVKSRIMKLNQRVVKPLDASLSDMKINMRMAPLQKLSFLQTEAVIEEPDDADSIYNLDVVDRKPVPVFRVPPIYPASAKKLGIEGWVLLQFVIDEHGSVVDVEVSDSSSRRFNQSAKTCAYSWRFKPAIKDERPVPVMCTQKLTFELTN